MSDMVDVKLDKLQETETEDGESGSASFNGEIGGALKCVFTIKGDKAVLDSYLAQLGASSLGDIIALGISPNKQSKL
jgi:hypothetical protein